MLLVLNITFTVVSNIVMLTYLQSLLLTVMSWVSKLSKLNKSAQPSAKRFLGLYTGLEKGMGPVFFLSITFTQITWITLIFLAISMATDGLSDAFDVAEFLAYFVGAIATMLQATSFIFCLSDCHKSLEILGNSLADDILEMEPGRERQEAEVLLKVFVNDHDFIHDISTQKIERLGPLTGLGLFTIERNTITSMVSVAVTYIIILIQFKITVKAK